ncbi:hypothetical protein GALL_487940 [mine drainage metagenome]|uniref:Uncharacterized protein n=1 Tax=mine drainage metagenome TaxID=410659 RepID=A0A1J5PPU2_9ZZZZ
MQGNQSEQFIGQLSALLRHAAHKGVARQLGVRQVVSGNALAKCLAVGANAADRNAAKAGAVITFFTADQQTFARLTLGAPVSACHLERGVGRLRAGIGEKHIVQPGRGQFLELVGQCERQRVTVLESRGVVERGQLLGSGFGDFTAAMAQTAAP